MHTLCLLCFPEDEKMRESDLTEKETSTHTLFSIIFQALVPRVKQIIGLKDPSTGQKDFLPRSFALQEHPPLNDNKLSLLATCFCLKSLRRAWIARSIKQAYKSNISIVKKFLVCNNSL